jgi:hypothetical protein
MPTVLARLLDSRKFLVLLTATLLVGIAVIARAATVPQLVDFLKWAVGAFAIGAGLDHMGPPPSAALPANTTPVTATTVAPLTTTAATPLAAAAT